MTRGILLAAGLSRRMGTQKLLLPFGGATVIEHIVDQLLASLLESVHVVAGRDADRIAGRLGERPVALVRNPDTGAEMLSSVRCGLRALPPCEGVLVALGDQPSITTELIDDLVAAFDASGKGIVMPTHKGRRGHPIVFSMDYRDEVLTRFDEVGLRGLPHAHPDDVLEVEVATSAVLADVDDPDDYRRELDRLNG